jgi:hypothetical protein
MEQRSRDWLVGYVTQKIPRTPRRERYLDLYQSTLDETCFGLDLNWLREGTEPGYFARSQTNAIGRLAFAWHTEELTFYGDKEVANMLRAAFLAVAGHITGEGQFVWPNDQDMYWAGSHEHAWRLEPLLIGFLWAESVFSESEWNHIDEALRRAANWLIANPCLQHNNRGAVWCAVATLCGLYYDRDIHLAVEPHAASILRGVICDDGEIGEHTEQYAGGGPCTNYTYTGLAYVYLYRLFSGDHSMDDLLLKGARWLSLYNSVSGYPLVAGASVRVAKPDPALADGLPFLEWASLHDPAFARLIDRHLDKLEGEKGGAGTHIISPTIWAMLVRGAAGDPETDWVQNRTEVYRRPNVHYALVGRHYQTGITFRARKGPYRDVPEEGVHLRGMQTFAYGLEEPILFHGRKIVSSTRVGEIETCSTDAIEVAKWAQDGADMICESRENLRTIYIYTPISAVVVYLCPNFPMRSFWSLFETQAENIALDPIGRAVAFSGREGRIYFLQGNAELYIHEEGQERRWILDVIAECPVSAFAFSNASFTFGMVTSENASFTDASGVYSIDLDGIK